MEFNIKKNKHSFEENYKKDDLDIAREFTKKISKEFGSFLKSVVLFGSHGKKAHGNDKVKKESDIDILVIIDDLSTIVTPELMQTYKIIMEKTIHGVSSKIHLTTLNLTTFWELVRNGDPVVINILRDGVAMIDTGIFDPLQALLYQGRIRPSWESVMTYYSRAPQTLHNSKWHILQATIDLYWAVLDASHAALMKVGEIPPTPSQVADLLDKSLHKTGIIHKKYITIMRNLHILAKKIIHREIREISGSEYDKHYKDAADFVETMKRVIDHKNLHKHTKKHTSSPNN